MPQQLEHEALPFELDLETDVESEALAETELDEILADLEAFEFDPEVDLFLGKAIKKAARAISRPVASVARTVSKPVTTVAKTAGKVAKTAGRIPVVGDIARTGFAGLRTMAAPATFAVNAGNRLARGESLGRALKGAASSYVKDVRQQMRFAEMVAPFVPGIGTGVAAALGAANALAEGRPITQAVIAAARSALPGGALAQTAFDVGVNLAQGRNLSQAALDAARKRLPGGRGAQAAFDAAVALAQGKRLQDAAVAAGRRALPPSPFAANATSFIQGVAAGRNVQTAALSPAGRNLLRQVVHEAGPVGYELEFGLEANFEDEGSEPEFMEQMPSEFSELELERQLSATTTRVLQAVTAGDFDGAFFTLNGLSMPDMLGSLRAMTAAQLVRLRSNLPVGYRRYNGPRLEAALDVEQCRRGQVRLDCDKINPLPGDQRQAIFRHLGDKPVRQPRRHPRYSISDAGVRLIAEHEGFVPRLYNDAAGHCTIGFGHLVHHGNCNGGEPIEFRQGLTRQQGIELLRQDVSRFVDAVNSLTRVLLTQNQFAALVSLAFNIGAGNLAGSTLLRRVNRCEFPLAAAEFERWTRAGGKILPGLVRRRSNERRLFETPQQEMEMADA